MKLAIIAAILVANLAATIAAPGPLCARGLEQDIVQIYGRANPDKKTPKSILMNPKDNVKTDPNFQQDDEKSKSSEGSKRIRFQDGLKPDPNASRGRSGAVSKNTKDSLNQLFGVNPPKKSSWFNFFSK